MTRFNPQKIYAHLSYTIKELSELLAINEKTCLRWIDEGLRIVPDSKKPILITGSDAKEFIRKRNTKKKVKLNRSEFYCLKCRGPTRAKRGSIVIVGNMKKRFAVSVTEKYERCLNPIKGLSHTQIPSKCPYLTLI